MEIRYVTTPFIKPRNIYRFALYFLLGKQMVKKKKLINRMVGKCVQLSNIHPNETMLLRLNTRRPIDTVLLSRCSLRVIKVNNIGVRTVEYEVDRGAGVWAGHLPTTDSRCIVWTTFQEVATIKNMIEVRPMMGEQLFNEALAGLALNAWYDVKYGD